MMMIIFMVISPKVLNLTGLISAPDDSDSC